MKQTTILAVPLIAGSLLYASGVSTAEPYGSPESPRVQQAPPSKAPPPPAPARQMPPEPVSPEGPEAENPTWMPMHYTMPMHYRMLEPEMIYGYQLMTPKERLDYMSRLHSARSFEMRDKIRLEHHRLMQERAKKRRMFLPDMPQPGRGPGRGPGPGPMR